MNKNKYIIVGAVLLLALAGGLWAYLGNNKDATPKGAQEVSVEDDQPEQGNTSLRIVATGDMIAHDSVIANAQNGDGYDFYGLMQRMEPYFDRADVRFCNEATPAGGEAFGISGYPVFNAPLEWHDGIEQVGCNVVNLGTNHTFDKGEPLVDAMVADWQERDVLATAGAYRSMEERQQISYFEVLGVRFAFLSYSTYTNAPVPNEYSLVRYDPASSIAEIQEAKSNADIVLVSMRWGDEYSNSANARDRQIAQDISQAGADYVFGHGPHVLQPVERIDTSDGRETVVWYSLGNFLNTQIPPETLVGGFAVMDIDIETLQLQELGFLPVYSHYEWSADEAAAQNLLARRNLQMYPLEEVDDSYFQRNQLDSSVQTELNRSQEILSRLTAIPILTPSEYLD